MTSAKLGDKVIFNNGKPGVWEIADDTNYLPDRTMVKMREKDGTMTVGVEFLSNLSPAAQAPVNSVTGGGGEPSKPNKCSCVFRDLLMQGCKCGGI